MPDASAPVDSACLPNEKAFILGVKRSVSQTHGETVAEAFEDQNHVAAKGASC